jgi:hypothetical protein
MDKKNCVDALTHVRRMEAMKQKPLNLRLDVELIGKIKIQAIHENRSVSAITDQLYREYLERQGKGKRKSKS